MMIIMPRLAERRDCEPDVVGALIIRYKGPRPEGVCYRVDAPVEYVIHHEYADEAAPEKAQEGPHPCARQYAAENCGNDEAEQQPIEIQRVDFEDGLVAVEIMSISVPADGPRALGHKQPAHVRVKQPAHEPLRPFPVEVWRVWITRLVAVVMMPAVRRRPPDNRPLKGHRA